MRYRTSLFLLAVVPSAANSAFPDPKDLPSRPDLPEPLVMLDGTKVASKEQWIEKRRPELKDLFQHYMYGTIPPPKVVTAKVLHEDAKAFGGKATLREVSLTALPGHEFRLLVVVPNSRKRPAPCFVGPNFGGNHALVDDPKVALPTSWMWPSPTGVKDNKATEEGRGKQKDVWNLEQSIDRGYAVATFYYGDIDPDRADVRGGIRPLLPKDLDTATIACWAWAIHRAVDYLTTLTEEVDPKRIAAVGHSRLGKTALLATAFDERIALAIPHQAGCGGTAPSRARSGPRRARPKASSASTPASRTGSTPRSRNSTTTRRGCPSINTAWSPCALRGPSCSPTPRRICGRTRRVSSRS